MLKIFNVALSGVLVFCYTSVLHAKPIVELNHWWVSEGELAAVKVIEQHVEKADAIFEATSLDNFDAFRMSLIERLSLGYRPASTHWLGGTELFEMADQDFFRRLPDRWRDMELDDILHPSVKNEVFFNGEYVGIPVGVHIQNIAYYNGKIYDELALTPPSTWDEFLSQAKVIESAGYTPLGVGHQAWQLRFIFESILMSKGGIDRFDQIFDPMQGIASHADLLRESFTYFAKLKQFTNPQYDQLKWSDHVKLMAQGEIAAHFMGDFAHSELEVLGGYQQVHHYCSLVPGANNVVVYGVDVFSVLDIADEAKTDGQLVLFDTVLSPDFQREYVDKKGGLPVRSDIELIDVDPCVQKIYAEWKDPTNKVVALTGGRSRLRMTALQNAALAVWQEGPDVVDEIVDNLSNTFK